LRGIYYFKNRSKGHSLAIPAINYASTTTTIAAFVTASSTSFTTTIASETTTTKGEPNILKQLGQQQGLQQEQQL